MRFVAASMALAVLALAPGAASLVCREEAAAARCGCGQQTVVLSEPTPPVNCGPTIPSAPA